MDVEVLKKNNEPLMHRSYFEAKIVFEGKTPSRPELMKDLCHKLSSKENMTIIRKINTDYGSERALLNGYVYDDETVMNKLETKFVKLRHLAKAEQKAEKEKFKAAKQAAAAAAAPAKGKKK
jgi:ribosomal protein S24E